MGHLIVEYSANIEDDIRLGALLETLHDAALETGVFPVAGLFTRAYACRYHRIADGHPHNAFVHVTALLGHGRPLDVRRRAAERLFGALTRHLEALYQARPLAISFNVQEFHPELNFKQNNLLEYVQSRRERARRNGKSG